jgi:membrane protease YdiL (CAAX protease family)
LHEELENALAAFYGREAALVFSTGYQANLGTISGLASRHDVVLLDRHVHASAIDAARLSGAWMKFFRHNDPGSLDSQLAVGRGTAAHFGDSDGADLVTIAFSKALASIGGAVIGDAEVVHYLRHRAEPDLQRKNVTAEHRGGVDGAAYHSRQVQLVAAQTEPGSSSSSEGGSEVTTQRVRSLPWVHRWYLAAPLTTAAVAYAVLATVRVAGAFQLVLAVLAIALTPCVLATVPRSSWSRIGVVRPVSGGRLALGCCVVLTVYALVAVGNVAVFGTGPNNWMTGVTVPFESLFPGNSALWVPAMIVAMGVLIPLFEEVCYRGVLLTAVLGRYGPWWAVFVTSAGWALVHLGNYGLAHTTPS